MQHAFIYGLVAALSFIGFVSLIYAALLFVYRPKGRSRYIIKIPHGFEQGDIETLIYGAYFKKMVFGDLLFDKIEIDKSALSEEEKMLVDCICEEIGCFTRIKKEDLFIGEENDERRP